jgi:hypothetical protein
VTALSTCSGCFHSQSLERDVSEVKPRQIWRIAGHPARVMNVVGDEVEVQYRDRPNAPNDLARTQGFSAKLMLRDAGRFKFLRASHELKSKSELENLILAKIIKHSVCAADIGVVVRGLGGGKWIAESVPPPESPIAYADCSNYIQHVAQELRQKLDLA